MEQQEERCEACGLVPYSASLRRQNAVVCASPAMRQVMQRAARFALSDAPVVIRGESGTGKEVVARTIHGNSARASKPFLAVNVAALPAELLESELFGHSRGAFTGAARAKAGLFEAAEGGSLFLDEIAELPTALQPKLLRALQDGEIRRVGDTRPFAVDVRILCATHGDLTERMAQGAFRPDLYYRLKVLDIHIPPLRERREDILPLVNSFLARFASHPVEMAEEAKALLLAHRWPGNVRELASAVQHALALLSGALIGVEHLPGDLTVEVGQAEQERPKEFATLAQLERDHIRAVLAHCGNNRGEAARILGIGRNTLWRHLKA